MTDFLTRLVERTLNLAPVVQPVIPPMFAPGPALTSPAGRDDSTERMADRPYTKDSRDQERPVVFSQRDVLLRTIPTQGDSSSVPSSHLGHKTDASPAARQHGPAPSSKQGHGVSSRMIAGQYGEKADHTTSSRPYDSSLKSFEEQSRPESFKVERSFLPQGSHLKPTVEPVQPAAELTPVEPFRQRAAEPLIVRPQWIWPSGPEGEKGPERGATRLEESQLRPMISGPTIKVTIGRIDVRAVMQQVPVPEPAKTPTPRLSLDDYLRSRDGGKR